MPSASLELDSQGSSDPNNPLLKVICLLEKKTRNLEKRKNKLEQYKNDLEAGKELIDDQRQAIASYDSVLANLELVRELTTQLNTMQLDHVKTVKKKEKVATGVKEAEEINRIREMLRIQDVLQLMGQEEVREDFLNGTNGAVILPPESLTHLDMLFKLVTPTRTEDQEPQDFQKDMQSSAEHMFNLLDGRKTEVSGTTYSQLMSIIDEVSKAPYPKRKIEEEDPVEEEMAESIPEELPEYTNGCMGDVEEPEELTNSIAADGPPPGLTSPVVSQVHPSVPTLSQEQTSIVTPAQEAIVAAMAHIPNVAVPNTPPQDASGLPPAPSSFFSQPPLAQPPAEQLHSAVPSAPTSQVTHPTPPQLASVHPSVQPTVQPPVQTPVQPPVHPPVQAPVKQVQSHFESISLSDLVSPVGFDFLQESQVAQETPAVYMDPAVVSIGSIKKDISPVQPLAPSPAPPVAAHAQEHTLPSSIPAQNFTNQTYPNLNVANYTPNVYSSTEVDTSPSSTQQQQQLHHQQEQPQQQQQPLVISQSQSQIEFNPDARPWTNDQPTSAQEPEMAPVSNLHQSQEDNWVSQSEPPAGDDKWVNDSSNWDEYEDSQGNSGAFSSNGQEDKRSGYRGGRSRGGFGQRGGYRGNRGGGGNYQNGRGAYGGGYGGGFRGGRGGMGVPRGGRGGFRGQGPPRGGFRGGRGSGQRPPFQQQQHMQ